MTAITQTNALDVRRDSLLERIRKAETRMDIRERLAIISEGFSYLAQVCAQETEIQTKALMVIMRDRAERQKNKNG